jgi:hypothetical protein
MKNSKQTKEAKPKRPPPQKSSVEDLGNCC